jgi:hypothetical protein
MPPDTPKHLTNGKEPSGQEGKMMKNHKYSRLLGKLIYLLRWTRPDIAFAVGVLRCYASNPCPCHWEAMQKLLRYIRDTKDLKISSH